MMDNKLCNIIRDVLPLYTDDAACPDTREWVEKHLAECPECRRIADSMRETVALPEMPDRNVDAMKHLRRFFNKRRLRTIIVAVLASFAAAVAAVAWLLLTVNTIEYDGSNIAIEESEDGNLLMLRYYGAGDFHCNIYTVSETGETTIELRQSLWDLHISPMYDAPQTRRFIIETDRTNIIRYGQTGSILWQNDKPKTE